ncbi:hypothetical protein SNEBB_005814 [Seison nebaliae]|nr:hypothetical protein SNEBB_005814 [Seison nebaliae]
MNEENIIIVQLKQLNNKIKNESLKDINTLKELSRKDIYEILRYFAISFSSETVDLPEHFPHNFPKQVKLATTLTLIFSKNGIYFKYDDILYNVRGTIQRILSDCFLKYNKESEETAKDVETLPEKIDKKNYLLREMKKEMESDFLMTHSKRIIHLLCRNRRIVDKKYLRQLVFKNELAIAKEKYKLNDTNLIRISNENFSRKSSDLQTDNNGTLIEDEGIELKGDTPQNQMEKETDDIINRMDILKEKYELMKTELEKELNENQENQKRMEKLNNEEKELQKKIRIKEKNIKQLSETIDSKSMKTMELIISQSPSTSDLDEIEEKCIEKLTLVKGENEKLREKIQKEKEILEDGKYNLENDLLNLKKQIELLKHPAEKETSFLKEENEKLLKKEKSISIERKSFFEKITKSKGSHSKEFINSQINALKEQIKKQQIELKKIVNETLDMKKVNDRLERKKDRLQSALEDSIENNDHFGKIKKSIDKIFEQFGIIKKEILELEEKEKKLINQSILLDKLKEDNFEILVNQLENDLNSKKN